MNEPWTFFAVPMSYFSAKVRPALRYKKIPFHEVWATIDVYSGVIVPKTGQAFIPVLVTPDGEFLQDSPRMLERIEQLRPTPALYPSDPVLRMVAELIQDFSDDALLLPAMHLRWNFPEQRKWIEDDWREVMGPESLEFAKRMSNTLPLLGITERTQPLIDDWYVELLDLLDSHLETSRFILGDRLTIADLALAGPFYAHLGRDPVPVRIMRERAPWVMAWLHELNDAAPPAPWAGQPEVRETLLPLLAEIGRVFVPMQMEVSRYACKATASMTAGDDMPRALGVIEQPILGTAERRIVNSYSVWRHVRSAVRYAELGESDRSAVDELLEPAGVLPYLREIPEARIAMEGFSLKVS